MGLSLCFVNRISVATFRGIAPSSFAKVLTMAIVDWMALYALEKAKIVNDDGEGGGVLVCCLT